MYTPVNPKFYHVKVGFKVLKLYRRVFAMSSIFSAIYFHNDDTNRERNQEISIEVRKRPRRSDYTKL